ncbi:MAG: hypothetical protein AAFO03_19840 [Bacteroidota bacterium]
MKGKSNDEQMLKRIQKVKQERQKIEQQDARANAPDLLAISEALDEYYFVNKLSLYCADLCYNKILQQELRELSLLKSILTHVDNLANRSIPLEIYNRIRKLLETINVPSKQMTQLFEETFQLVVENENVFSSAESVELYSLLSNYCIRRINERKARWNERFVSLHYRMLCVQFKSKRKKAILLPEVLKNLVVTALSIRNESFFQPLHLPIKTITPPRNTPAASWAEQLIQSYYKKLPATNLAKNYLIYCRSFLEFEEGNFARSYKILQNHTHIRGTFLNLDFKILHLKILYEINSQKPAILEYDEIKIRGVLDAYRKLIDFERKKKQQLSYQTFYYTRFRELYGVLLKLEKRGKSDRNKKNDENLDHRKAEFAQKINEHNFYFNPWMLEKLDKIGQPDSN